MLILGIDPGSVKTGWAILETDKRKVKYIDSGVLSFDAKMSFLERLTEIKVKSDELLQKYSPDEIALESLIYVKSPTALIKLAQARGMIISSFVKTHKSKIFEYSPNLIKSSTVGHGHADKDSVQKFLTMMLGDLEFKTHDESDAIAIAFCHILNRNKMTGTASKKSGRSKGNSSLANAVKHKIKDLR